MKDHLLYVIYYVGFVVISALAVFGLASLLEKTL